MSEPGTILGGGASDSTGRPRWLSLVLGLVCVALGIVLTLRPFASLGALVIFISACFFFTGASELAGAGESERPGLARAVGVAWMIAAVIAVAWAGITIGALAILAGVSLVLGGVARIVTAARGEADGWLITVLGGVAGITFGVLALVWTDVTVLVLAVFVGARTILYGAGQIAAVLRREQAAAAGTGRLHHSRWPRWLRFAGAAAAVVLALGLLALSVAIHRGAPKIDAFYTAPARVPRQPGALLRSAPFTRSVPAGAQAWRILYTTTRSDGTPTVASAIVLTSTQLPPGPRPVIAWAHGTTGVVPKCAPSLLPNPFTAGALPALDQVVAMGWVLVATDYTGLGTRGPHPYLVGEGEARSVLDAVRAAREMRQLQLADNTVVWGHSQGGNAALWTGIIAPSYAPDVKLAGVAALAPASDLVGLVANLPHVPGGSIFASYVIAPYSEIYHDAPLDAYVRPAAQAIVRTLATRCLAEPAIFASIVTSLAAGTSIFRADPRAGALGGRLRQNSPDSYIAAPLLVAQGEADQLVLPAVQAAWVNRRCATGQSLEYRTYPGRDHVGVVAADSPLVGDLLRWTDERFQGVAPPHGCHRLHG